MKPVWILSAWLAASGSALAQQTPALVPADSSTTPLSAPAEALAPSAASDRLPAGTIVELELTEAVASSRNQRGDKFRLRVVEAVSAHGRIVIPAGSLATGQIVHAAASGGGGKPGELLLAARTIDAQGGQIALRGMKLGASGKDNMALALGVSIALGPFGFFVHGREIEIPAGTRAHAKLAQDVPLDTSIPQAPAETSLADAQIVQPTAIEPSASSSNQE